MKHIRSVSKVPGVAADIDIPALIKSSADAVSVLLVGISVAKLVSNVNDQVNILGGQLDLSSKTS